MRFVEHFKGYAVIYIKPIKAKWKSIVLNR